MDAVSLVARRKFDCISVNTPVPLDDEVLIRVKVVGICYTDVEMFNGTQPYSGWDWPAIRSFSDMSGLAKSLQPARK